MINEKDFTLIAGNPAKWDEELLKRVRGDGEEIVRVQEDQHARGRRSAALLHKLMGWAVTTGSSLDAEGFIRHGEDNELASHFETRTEAMVVGKAWAEEDPENREFYALKKYFEEYEEDGTEFDDDDS